MEMHHPSALEMPSVFDELAQKLIVCQKVGLFWPVVEMERP